MSYIYVDDDAQDWLVSHSEDIEQNINDLGVLVGLLKEVLADRNHVADIVRQMEEHRGIR